MADTNDLDPRRLPTASLQEYLGPDWVEVEPGIFEPPPEPRPLEERLWTRSR